MDHQQVRDHLQILNLRVASLEQELNVALSASKAADDRIKALNEGLNTIATNRLGRTQEIETRFEAEKSDCNRQIKLAEDVLTKKIEERQALMTYIRGLELNERSFDELREFDWNSLQRLAENIHKPSETLLEQYYKAESLNETIQKAKLKMTELYEVLSSTTFFQDRLNKSLDEFKGHFNTWARIRVLQEKRINKVQGENERLNTLIRQCIATNEPMSEYITRNIQKKCHSFVHSKNSQELLDGLMKFRSRQDRIIKLLQYKDNKLGSVTNKLQVAKDQTHDQVRFYLNMLNARRGANLNTVHTDNLIERQNRHQIANAENGHSSIRGQQA